MPNCMTNLLFKRGHTIGKHFDWMLKNCDFVRTIAGYALALWERYTLIEAKKCLVVTQF